MKSPCSIKSFLLVLCLCCSLAGCAAHVPEDEQLLSAAHSLPLQKSQGTCTDTLFTELKTDMSRPGLSPERISIFDWNTYKGQRKNWESDFQEFSHGKDIILLQEAALTQNLQHSLQEKALHWNLNSAFRYKGLETGVLLASTVPPLNSCGLRTDEPLIGVPKTILISRYNIKNSAEDLLVANIHAINITLGTGSYREQFNGLQDILEKHDGPILLAGDFNNWNRERKKIMTALVDKLSLQVLAFDEENRTTFFGEPVDHILYRGLKPLSYEIHQVTSSDHNPISVVFRIVTKELAVNTDFSSQNEEKEDSN
jgi:endonuclease/exonuclease/phosphatase (EEP) superfamily protein YafD